ncbi:MAG: hypothetical protein OXC15_07130 [Rhodospirillaceae bacterium]|nr:hypothetical protein [Rhodospirillaceae bacterium]
MSEYPIDDDAFRIAFDRFCALVEARSGHPFRSFDEGLAAAWENYKPKLREHALGLLRPGDWSEGDIGSGAILNRTIEAIEIQDGRLNLVNNLVFWQNRYGHANRDHRAILEAASNPGLRGAIEGLLFGLYRGGADEGTTFDRLQDAMGSKYPLLAYLFFLKDMRRFMPIQPTGFDRAFRALGIEFSTLRQCNWENYTSFNTTLDGLRPLIAHSAGLDTVRLVDAHSFCWIFSTLLKREAEGTLERASGGRDEGRVLGGRERAVAEMRYSVENTVRNASGQTVGRRVKNKELRMIGAALERHIADLLELQGERCALTGIRFRFHGTGADDNLLPSVDRIDSDGQYEVGNMQIVCRFVNFWKSDTPDEEFRRLLTFVRGEEEPE